MAAKKPVKHVGFKGAVSAVMRRGKSKAAANRIIGAGKANASAAAKKANPALKKTGGKKVVPSKRQRAQAATKASRKASY